jgi:hypothetical protein
VQSSCFFGFPSLVHHLHGLVISGCSNQGRSFHAEVSIRPLSRSALTYFTLSSSWCPISNTQKTHVSPVGASEVGFGDRSNACRQNVLSQRPKGKICMEGREDRKVPAGPSGAKGRNTIFCRPLQGGSVINNKPRLKPGYAFMAFQAAEVPIRLP